MNYDGLEKNYWTAQSQRVEQLREKISNRPAVGKGLVLPTDESLTVGEGRRLNMAIMFIDVCGFSSRSMSMPEEQDMTLRTLNLFFSEMVRLAEDYGGTIEKHTGDGLMVYFEDNASGFDPSGSKRAVACAMTMQAVNATLISPILARSPGTSAISFRTSIDYGPVTVALLGLPKRFQSLVAIGSTANFACKMLRKAGPDEIVLGQALVARIPSAWHQFALLVPEATGWTLGGAAYPLYKFIGRWTKLV